MPSAVTPKHIPKTFTSTLEDPSKKTPFNYWLIFMTAVIFFTVLSFYTFLLSLFGYFVRNDDDNDKDNRRGVLSLLAFFLVWLAFLIIIYIILDSREMLFT